VETSDYCDPSLKKKQGQEDPNPTGHLHFWVLSENFGRSIEKTCAAFSSPGRGNQNRRAQLWVPAFRYITYKMTGKVRVT